MLAKGVWLGYLVAAFLVAPTLFRIRHGRSPIVYAWPTDLYAWVDGVYAACTGSYTVWLFAVATPQPISTAGGIAPCVGAFALQCWSLVALGSAWRIGQRPNDPNSFYVTTGPYRFFKHPVYLSLAGIATGMALLTGWSLPAVAFVLITIIYGVWQGRRESEHWSRRRSDADRPTTPSP